MAEDKEERRGFQVKDRRRFSESGEARGEDADEAPASSPGPAPGAASAEERAEEPVTFSTFVLGLSTQVLLHLGEDPQSGDPCARA